jgi:protease-4
MPPGLPAEGRPVSFFVALFLALLLLISGAINIFLLLVVMASGAPSMAGGTVEADEGYQIVAVAGDLEADDHILQIAVEGAIAEGASPVIGADGGTVSHVRRQLRLAGKDDKIKAVLLRINSPGGGVTDSDEIYLLIKDFRERHRKPVLAYLGDVAASGGYYIAAACDRIVCRPTSITGSIGVIMSSFNLAKLMDDVGVSVETVISPNTPYKDMLSFSRPMTDGERGILGSIVEEMYQRFVDIVDAGRPELSRAHVLALADGRIYSANQAHANGLVDEILQPEAAIDALQKLAGLARAKVVEQRRIPTLMERLLGVPAAAASEPSLASTLSRFANQTTGSHLLYFWPGGR